MKVSVECKLHKEFFICSFLDFRGNPIIHTEILKNDGLSQYHFPLKHSSRYFEETFRTSSIIFIIQSSLPN